MFIVILFLKMVYPISGVLEDRHILHLSLRITDKSQLRRLGTNLQLPTNVIESVLSRHNGNIIEAAHEVLSRWLTYEENRREAYSHLLTALKGCNMNLLATQLTEWVEDDPQTENSKFLWEILNLHCTQNLKELLNLSDLTNGI